MGLAASQARFLGITARKNHCELKSMQIAQEKLSITNQLTQISQDYERSLDATRLVWDSDLIIDGSIYDVTYDLLMKPSDLNNYSPQLLTNRKNQIVVNNQLANALEVAGVAQAGGSERSRDKFNIFIDALNKAGLVSKTEAENIKDNTKDLYHISTGLGGEIQETFSTNIMNLNQLKNFINAVTDDQSKYRTSLAEKCKEAEKEAGHEKTRNEIAIELANILNFKIDSTTDLLNSSLKKVDDPSLGDWISNKGGWTESGGKKTSTLKGTTEISNSNFNFADLLTNDVIFSSKGDATTRDNDMALVLEKFITQMYQVMTNLFQIDPNSVDSEYLTFAMSQACELVGLKWDSTSSKVEIPRNSEGNFKPNYVNTSDSASAHTGIVVSGNKLSVSLSNIAKNIMTYFELAIEGFNSGYKVESSKEQQVKESYYVTKDPDYQYFVKNPTALDSTESETLLLLEFYAQMFNQICANGWTESNTVEDPEALKNMLKNGTLFTSTLADDGMFYQGPYTSNNFIAEVADEDAIARAEADFRINQAKLNAKEERLNVDMQMVDAELAALTTEYDTVKQMISKGIEKGFSTLGG